MPMNPNPNPNPNRPSKPVVIRAVYRHNLDSEFALIRSLIDDFPIISMDTEFPGVVTRSNSSTKTLNPQTNYYFLKANVDQLHLIQVGITLSNHEGDLPDLGTKSSYIWEFNFADFDVSSDLHNPDSIEMLRLQGVDFESNRTMGIGSVQFGELLMSSGLVCNDSVTWITFHCAYDFGYMVKTLTQRRLPDSLEDFLGLVRVYFGHRVFDVKHIIRFVDPLYGGLNKVCSLLNVDRIVGRSHQAGSDSLLTLHAFRKIRQDYFPQEDGLQNYANVLYGLELSERDS